MVNYQLEKYKYTKYQLDTTPHQLPEISPPPRTYISLKRLNFHNLEYPQKMLPKNIFLQNNCSSGKFAKAAP